MGEELAGFEKIRSLRNDDKISRQSNLQFQNFIVVAFPTKTSVFARFSSLPPNPPPLKSENFIFIVVSPSLKNRLDSPKVLQIFRGSAEPFFNMLFAI